MSYFLDKMEIKLVKEMNDAFSRCPKIKDSLKKLKDSITEELNRDQEEYPEIYNLTVDELSDFANAPLRTQDQVDLTELKSKVEKCLPGEVFKFCENFWVKTSLGHIDLAHNYINVLEKTVIDQTQKLNNFNNLTFWQTIKLAFTKLWRKNG